jgi:phosphatidylglycerol:prolipoprotein diacylglycerol transferase
VQPQIDIVGLPIKTFGVMFALGFLVSGAIIWRRLKELGKPSDWAYEMVFAALVGGLVGARLYWVLQHWSQVSGDLPGSLFSGSGLVWYGGALGGAAGVLLWAHRRDFLGLVLLDVCAVPLAVGYAIGRIGCQLSGDGDYGIASSLPWAMAYPKGTVPTTVAVHPTPVYETVVMGLVGWWLWRHRDAFKPGVLFAFYLVLAGTERLLVEFIRRNDAVILGLTAPQLTSLVMMAAGAIWLVRADRRGGIRREGTTAGPPGAASPAPPAPAAGTAR